MLPMSASPDLSLLQSVLRQAPGLQATNYLASTYCRLEPPSGIADIHCNEVAGFVVAVWDRTTNNGRLTPRNGDDITVNM